MSLISQLQQAILPGKIRSVHVGLSRTAVLAETEDGLQCGLAATLHNPEYQHQQHPSVRQAGYLHEMGCAELAALIESPSLTEVSIGMATINALLPRTPEAWVELNAEDFLLQNCAGKNVAMIGHFPCVDRLKSIVRQLWVLELKPREGDLPAHCAPEVLPQADYVAITGTTLINKTFDGLIALCDPHTQVVMLGPSTPLSPLLFEHGIDLVGGTIVDDAERAMMGISQGVSFNQLRDQHCIRLVTMTKKG